MNIQCQQCGTSYSVADEKVAGRVMKVRCRTCSEPIRVDGTLLGVGAPDAAQVTSSDAVATPEQMARVQIPGSNPPGGAVRAPSHAPVGGDPNAVWHIAVGDTTQGPYTIEELREYYAQGSVMLDTPVFRDGWSDWRSAGEVAELRPRVVSQPGAAAFSGGVSMGSDPFGERAAASSPRVSAAQMLQEGGSGKDSTVQFSLDQIRALSSVSSSSGASMPAPRPASILPPASEVSFGSLAASTSSYPSAGYASGEGSGLIDVRKLAELHASMQREEEAPRGESLLENTHAAFSQTLAPLSLPLPAAPQAQGLDGRTKLFAGVAALGMVLAAAVAVLAITREPSGVSASVDAEQPAAAAAVVGQAMPEPAAMVAEKTEAKVEDDEQAEAPSEGEKAAAEQAAAEQAGAEGAESAAEGEETAAKSGKARASRRDKRASRKSDKAEKADDDVLAAAPAKKEKASSKSEDVDSILDKPAPKKSSGGSSSIDDLLDGAIAGASKKPSSKPAPAEAPKPASNLPQTPSRDDMLAALTKAKSKAAKCKGPGVATAAIKIAGSGRVSSVDVSGVDGAAKSCVEKAVKSTSFPKFQKDSFDVKFPFKLGN